jgi:hypothetical protein
MGRTVGSNQSSVAYDYQLFNVVFDNATIPDFNLNWNLLKLDQQFDYNGLCADSGTKE